MADGAAGGAAQDKFVDFDRERQKKMLNKCRRFVSQYERHGECVKNFLQNHESGLQDPQYRKYGKKKYMVQLQKMANKIQDTLTVETDDLRKWVLKQISNQDQFADVAETFFAGTVNNVLRYQTIFYDAICEIMPEPDMPMGPRAKHVKGGNAGEVAIWENATICEGMSTGNPLTGCNEPCWGGGRGVEVVNESGGVGRGEVGIATFVPPYFSHVRPDHVAHECKDPKTYRRYKTAAKFRELQKKEQENLPEGEQLPSGSGVPRKLLYPYEVMFKNTITSENTGGRDTLPMREIRADSIGALGTFECTVIKVSAVKPKLEVATYQCQVKKW